MAVIPANLIENNFSNLQTLSIELNGSDTKMGEATIQRVRANASTYRGMAEA